MRTESISEAELTTRADDQPFVARIRRFALEELRPRALETDAAGVTPATVERLRELGLLAHQHPALTGDSRVDAATQRRLYEHISAGCFNTWLVWAQHYGAGNRVAQVAESGTPPSPLGQQILRGEVLAGTGISDVRRFPDRYVDARRVAGGWELNGAISWISGWGLNQVLYVAGVDASTKRVVSGLMPVSERTRAVPLALESVKGSRTERVVLESARIEDEDVLETVDLAQWQDRDHGQASNAGPHAFGLAAVVLDELAAESHPGAQEVAARWAPRVAGLRGDAYELARLAATTDPLMRADERTAIKVAIGEALQVLTRALLIVRAGRGLVASNTAQLHARNALFVLIQGQTDWVRDAQLARLTNP